MYMNVKIDDEEEKKPLDKNPRSRIGRLFRTKERKIIASILGLILVLGILYTIPFTRYGILGLVVKKDVTVTIVDSKTKQPVSNALVKIGGISNQTDRNGVVTLPAVPVGQEAIEVTKKFYTKFEHAYTVPVVFGPESPHYEIVATGRPVRVDIVNKISGEPVEDVLIAVGDAQSTTDASGQADLVLSPDEDVQEATVTKDGFNSQGVQIKTTNEQENLFEITPSGSLYYLSNVSGKVSVMKADLDGANATVVVEGTGEETDYSTSIISSRDWKYSTLVSDRDGKKQKLYLIDDARNDFVVMDEGDAGFSPVGWSGHNFVYTIERKVGSPWDNKRYALKIFNADTRKLSIVDETVGQLKLPEGMDQGGADGNYSSYEMMSSAYILGDEVVYAKHWMLGFYARQEGSDKYPTSFMRADIASASKKVVRTFIHTSKDMIELQPNSLYSVYARFTYDDQDEPSFYEYKDKSLKDANGLDLDKYYSARGYYLQSPIGEKTLSYAYRDGKHAILLGDGMGQNSKVIGNIDSSYYPIGWFGDNDEYILLSKDSKSIYITSIKNITDGDTDFLKVTDLYAPARYGTY